MINITKPAHKYVEIQVKSSQHVEEPWENFKTQSNLGKNMFKGTNSITSGSTFQHFAVINFHCLSWPGFTFVDVLSFENFPDTELNSHDSSKLNKHLDFELLERVLDPFLNQFAVNIKVKIAKASGKPDTYQGKAIEF
ncbi:CLUMA_CG010201, isoform A [Clunio marinus]|uniref:CLUMA_CG010201, isoform A n=1 Tax=Clunio marinus TaxID=568069 RepID=A0A1J1IDP8_9DIPT|nr:CLUMA_CG010201, isoform A [Clunio marinus]